MGRSSPAGSSSGCRRHAPTTESRRAWARRVDNAGNPRVTSWRIRNRGPNPLALSPPGGWGSQGASMMTLFPGGLTRDSARLCARPVHSVGKHGASLRGFLRDPSAKARTASIRPATTGALAVPYIDINPHRSRPKWWAYVGLLLLALATVVVVVLALTPR